MKEELDKIIVQGYCQFLFVFVCSFVVFVLIILVLTSSTLVGYCETQWAVELLIMEMVMPSGFVVVEAASPFNLSVVIHSDISNSLIDTCLCSLCLALNSVGFHSN